MISVGTIHMPSSPILVKIMGGPLQSTTKLPQRWCSLLPKCWCIIKW